MILAIDKALNVVLILLVTVIVEAKLNLSNLIFNRVTDRRRALGQVRERAEVLQHHRRRHAIRDQASG